MDKPASLFAALLALLATPAIAQLQFSELNKRHLPTVRDDTRAVALGDVDRDDEVHLNLMRQLDDQRHGRRDRPHRDVWSVAGPVR